MKVLSASVVVGLAGALAPQRARRPVRSKVTMEDFGLMKGTKFSFREEWGKHQCLTFEETGY